MIKKSFFVAVLLALSVMVVEAFEPPSKPEGYVTDLAKVFSPNAKTILTYKLDNLAKKTKYKPQVVVLTVPTIDDTPLFNAATDTFKKWKLGIKGKDNGILILVAVKEKETRIEVGYGIEQYLSTIHLSEFFALVKPDLDKGDYDKAINQLVVHIASVLVDVKDETKIDKNIPTPVFIILGMFIIFSIIMWFIFKPRKNNWTNSSYDQSVGSLNRGYSPNRPNYPASASKPSSSDSGAVGDVAAATIGYVIGSMTSSNTSSESRSSEPSFSGGSGGETSGGGYSSSDSSSSSDSGGGGETSDASSEFISDALEGVGTIVGSIVSSVFED